MFASASVKRRFVSAVVLGLASVKVMTLVPPWEIGLVPKALAIVGEAETVSVAVLEAAPALPLSVLATPEVVLFQAPAVVPVDADGDRAARAGGDRARRHVEARAARRRRRRHARAGAARPRAASR